MPKSLESTRAYGVSSLMIEDKGVLLASFARAREMRSTLWGLFFTQAASVAMSITFRACLSLLRIEGISISEGN